MYLLNRLEELLTNKRNLFTFHYVSIKSTGHMLQSSYTSPFTFHYVSIKSGITKGYLGTNNKFTFHYVSIKSNMKI